MRRELRQTVVIYGRECVLTAQGQTYIVRGPDGRVLARAPTRLLAVARAALEVVR
jgi:hypothetical protein